MIRNLSREIFIKIVIIYFFVALLVSSYFIFNVMKESFSKDPQAVMATFVLIPLFFINLIIAIIIFVISLLSHQSRDYFIELLMSALSTPFLIAILVSSPIGLATFLLLFIRPIKDYSKIRNFL
ncbi:hypothetical protein HYV91_00970 [Candidatus Wolfebacteria bacterium]|nr:hypothetical protein [Candidatus Wolfebacteria bacterium]